MATVAQQAAQTQRQLAQRVRYLQQEASTVDTNIADLTHTYIRMGETSDWRDTRLPELDETITFWKNRHRGLVAQMSEARTQLISKIASQAVSRRVARRSFAAR